MRHAEDTEVLHLGSIWVPQEGRGGETLRNWDYQRCTKLSVLFLQTDTLSTLTCHLCFLLVAIPHLTKFWSGGLVSSSLLQETLERGAQCVKMAPCGEWMALGWGTWKAVRAWPTNRSPIQGQVYKWPASQEISNFPNFKKTQIWGPRKNPLVRVLFLNYSWFTVLCYSKNVLKCVCIF